MQDTVAAIERAIGTTGCIVAGIRPEQWAGPTPCDGWDVVTVVNHVVGGMEIYAAELTGATPARAHEDDWLGDDPLASYHRAAASVLQP